MANPCSPHGSLQESQMHEARIQGTGEGGMWGHPLSHKGGVFKDLLSTIFPVMRIEHAYVQGEST